METDALRWHSEGKTVVCDLCPHRCSLSPGQKGFCSVRLNVDGKLKTLNYGVVSSVAMDPVEKKPLFHWHPGEYILSLGGIGCTMDCPFCQNWQLTRLKDENRTTTMGPSRISALSRKYETDLIAFTYNEPLASYEFLMDALAVLKNEGKKTVLVTNGQINEEALSDLLPSIDAANVDVKTFDDEVYKKMGGDLTTVRSTVDIMNKSGIHVEISWLVVPGLSDDVGDFRSMTEWLRDIDPLIPLHVNRYYPARHWNASPTPVNLMDDMADIASENLLRVYQGNRGCISVTRCLSCGSPLIIRDGYRVDLSGLSQDGTCSRCGTPSDIVL